MRVYQRLNMDLARCGCTPIIGAVQGEANTRTLVVSLYDNGVAWEIPAAAAVEVAFKKPDGTQGIYSKLPDGSSATSFEDNVLTATMAPQMLTCAGNVLAAFIFRKSGGKILASFPFTVTVTANPAAGAEQSEDYYNPSNVGDLLAMVEALTAADVGAAPAGFGLGAGCQKIDGVNNIDKNGWWLTNSGTPNNAYWMLTARQTNSGNNVVADGYNLSGGNRAQRVKDKTWGEWEWFNPPMNPNTEYRTTERWDNKVVYTKLIDMGGTSSALYVPHGVTCTRFIRYSGSIGAYPLASCSGASVEINESGISLTVSQSNLAGLNVKVQLWYVKD